MEKKFFKATKITCEEVKTNKNEILEAKCIFIQGMDLFQKDRALKEILNILNVPINDNERSYLYYADEYSDKIKIGAILDVLNMFTFEMKERVVTIRNIEDLNKDALEKLLKYTQDPFEQSKLIMIYEEDKISYPKYKIIKNIQNNSLIIETKEIRYENELSPMVDIILTENKLKMEDNTKKFFLNKMGTKTNQVLIEKSEKSHYYIEKEEFDVYNALNEIKKLDLFIGNNNIITIDDINKCTLDSKTYTITDLEEAIGYKQKKNALKIIEYLVQDIEDFVMVNGKICSFFFFLWKLEAELRNGKNLNDLLIERKIIKASWKQYAIDLRVNKYKTFLNNYNRNKILNALKQIYICDSRKKLSAAEDKILMTAMICGIIK